MIKIWEMLYAVLLDYHYKKLIAVEESKRLGRWLRTETRQYRARFRSYMEWCNGEADFY